MGIKSSRKIDKLLLITGAVLLLVYVSAQIESFVMSRAALWSFATHRLRTSSAQPRNEQPADFTFWSASRIRKYKDALGMKLEAPLAVLSIPRLRLEVPVFAGTDELTLNRGAGWIAGTAKPGIAGNIGIAAHRDGFFRGLKDIHLGDRIELETQDRTSIYTVDRIEIVSPTEVGVLRARPRASLTLVTCYPFYFVGSASRRYIVQASMVDAEAAASGLNPAAQKTISRR
jgi:sortase A